MPAQPIIILDSGPLGLLARRKGIPPADACRAWLRARIADSRTIVIPEIADYEVRRELLRLNAHHAIARLDALCRTQTYLPITTGAMRRAAELWATARISGRPTADPHALDGDVILSAQTLTSGFTLSDLIVATTNAIHLSQFVRADVWDQVE